MASTTSTVIATMGIQKDGRHMISEPTSSEIEAHPPEQIPATQPQWMTITVALSGIIGLVVMIYLVFGK
jgi:hypothetical protein